MNRLNIPSKKLSFFVRYSSPEAYDEAIKRTKEQNKKITYYQKSLGIVSLKISKPKENFTNDYLIEEVIRISSEAYKFNLYIHIKKEVIALVKLISRR